MAAGRNLLVGVPDSRKHSRQHSKKQSKQSSEKGDNVPPKRRAQLATQLVPVADVRGAAYAMATLTLFAATSAAAAEPAPTPSAVPPVLMPTAPETTPEDEPAPVEETTPPVPSTPPLVITGYVDVGYAKAQGNGTSWPDGQVFPGPADYYVDTFAPAVNSRGDVASTIPPLTNPQNTTNGFLPRSAGIGGQGSFLLNTANVDVRYTASELPVMVFTRMQLVPRLYFDDLMDQGAPAGENTRVVLEQAFGRLTPLKSAELAISVGKFDSVFGIEYLDNQANFRIGVTPSLIARYTTGQSVGVKVFYRAQIIPAASAVSINAAATNNGTFVESLQGPSRSLNGVPVASVRLGYELNLERISFKLGASASYGPRNDQTEGTVSKQTLYGFDARLVAPTLTLSGEYVHVEENDASGGKLTGIGMFPMVTEFYAHGFYVQVAEELPLQIAPFRITIYGRYERRNAEFETYSNITVDRITGGVNVGLGESLQVKAEYLDNRELAGAPQVANNVFTSSVVWTW
jgi:hypothetical protein